MSMVQLIVMEAILCAAIWYDDGNLYPHQEIYGVDRDLSLVVLDIIILLVLFLPIINIEMMVKNIKQYKVLSHLVDVL